MNWITGAAGYTAILGALALAVAAHFFAPRAWSALAWTIAFGVLGAAFVGQREITASVRIEAAEQATKRAEEARAAGLAEGRAEVQAVLDAERAASAAAARQYEADHRAQMDAAAATARQREAALKTQMTGVRRALWTATENLASCRLDRDAVRLLRDAARGPAANQPATARTD